MNRKRRSLFAVSLILLMFFCSLAVHASGSTTTVRIRVEGESIYELIIPASTSVKNYGWTPLASNLKVKGTLDQSKQVNVTVTSKNGFQFVSAGSVLSIPYTLKQRMDGAETKSLSFDVNDVTDSGDPGKELGVFVEQDAWNAVPGGDYVDVLTFTAELTGAGQ